MKIKLFSNLKLVEFYIPERAFGSFALDENDDNLTKLINIEAIEDEWYLMSNSSVKIITSTNSPDKLKLTIDTFYVLERNNIRYLIYTESICDKTYKKYKYNSLSLNVGRDNSSHIFYDCQYINGSIINITYNNHLILNKLNDSVPIYVNKKYIRNAMTRINYGDLIEIFGLKIIVINGYVLVNNPKDLVSLRNISGVLELVNFTVNNNYIDGEIKELDLYTEKDYFSKSPRIRRKIQKKAFKIDSPNIPNVQEDSPLLFTLIPMLLMGMTSSLSLVSAILRIGSGETTFKDQWVTILMGASMLCTTILWPLIIHSYNKRRIAKARKNAIKKYKIYLVNKKNAIRDEAILQRDIIRENLVSVNDCIEVIKGTKLGLWSRRVEQPDFLTARIGSGNCPLDVEISVPDDSFSLDDEPLKKEAMNIAKEYEILENVPVGYSFLHNHLTAIMGGEYKTHKFIENIILDLATFHSFDDLKIVIFTNEKNAENWEFVKYLPHNFDNFKQIRFFASTYEESDELAGVLQTELNYRRYDENMQEVDRNYLSCRPYYLIITDNYQKIRRLGLMKELTEVSNNYGYSMIFLENLVRRLPSKCNNFITIGDKTSEILLDAYEDQKTMTFTDNINYDIDMDYVSKRLSNIPIEFERNLNNFPNTVSFLQMEEVGKVEQLNIINRWHLNNPTKSLKAEVGIDENGEIMYLDLHEKYHGPHGLIAGMTGSGKSEFIITYVLSMAVNYSPLEVSFILIDYKGGGLAGAFENKNLGIKLPHVAGTITNLDKAEMDRTLVSIDSELRRRQQMFNEARDKLGESTIDIYKYQQFYRDGRLSEPIPHLIIICDEFAELKSQQPDFMDNLISIARIGRSLGVHLILATQKPSGVVNDQIWSNSKFRVCLKVQDKSDSMEMLKRPEAAEITNVGRFYLQVGYNEYFALGQSAWCGAKYYPSDKVNKPIDRSINFVNDLGVSIKNIQSAKKAKSAPQGEELGNIVKHVIDAAKVENISSPSLWLENIPETIYVDNLVTKYNVNFSDSVVAILGEFDDPGDQKQDILKINLNTNGNTIFYSVDGSDKEMAIESIIYSTTTRYKADKINYYIVDYGSESLRMFSNFPNVGDMIFLGEEEKLNNLMKLISETISERKKLFADYGGEYNNYIKRSGKVIPLIGVVINNYDAFIENNPNIEDDLITVIREGLRYGIFFIISANGANSIRYKIKQSFNSIYALRLNDSSDYSDIFSRTTIMPKSLAGRGLFKTDKVYEFQTAKITELEKLNDYILNVGSKLKEINGDIKAKMIPILPEKVLVDKYLSNSTSLKSMPIGIDKASLDVVNYNLTTYLSTFVLSTLSTNTIKFSEALLKSLSVINNLQLLVIDMNQELKHHDFIKYYYSSAPDKVINILIQYVEKLKSSPTNMNTVIYIQNLDRFKSKIEDNDIEQFTKVLKTLDNVSLIIADDYKKLKKYDYDAWYRNIVNDTNGIWIGTGLSDQNLFKLSRLTKEMGYTYPNNFGYAIEDGRCTLMKTIELDIKEDSSNE